MAQLARSARAIRGFDSFISGGGPGVSRLVSTPGKSANNRAPNFSVAINSLGNPDSSTFLPRFRSCIDRRHREKTSANGNSFSPSCNSPPPPRLFRSPTLFLSPLSPKVSTLNGGAIFHQSSKKSPSFFQFVFNSHVGRRNEVDYDRIGLLIISMR